jgi:dCTP deaminase
MFLSDRDIKWAVESGKLLVDPQPAAYDENSIDLQLDDIERGARVWDIAALESRHADSRALGIPVPATINGRPCLDLGQFDYRLFADQFLIRIPPRPVAGTPLPSVFQEHGVVYVQPGGFLLWTTREEVGTPRTNPELISFVNAKSTKARTGIMVHLTAPTINSGWRGRITLEIANLGPFVFTLKAGDRIAQLTVATISSCPDARVRSRMSVTQGQLDPSGGQGPNGGSGPSAGGNRDSSMPTRKVGKKKK